MRCLLMYINIRRRRVFFAENPRAVLVNRFRRQLNIYVRVERRL